MIEHRRLCPAQFLRPRPARRAALRCAAALCALLAWPLAGHAEDVAIAAAANYRAPMQALVPVFEQSTGHHVLASYGATGTLYAQIRAGAPFAVLLAADSATPARLAAEGQAVPATRFTYAIGRLALWSAQPGLIDGGGAVLRGGHIDRLALANPALAPYGRAAVQALRAMGLHDALAEHLVQGEDISQTHAFVASGNAQAGFVALSQVFRDGAFTSGSGWIVPEELYEPVRQDAVLLKPGAGQAGALAWLDFLHSDAARKILHEYGYGP